MMKNKEKESAGESSKRSSHNINNEELQMSKLNGLSEKEQEMLAAYLKHQAYMKAYNTRPEVKAKRKGYNSQRWAMMKAAREIAKERGIEI